MKKKNFSNFSLLIFFISFVFLLIFSSITYRVVRLVQRSSFNSSEFTFIVVAKDVSIVHIDKNTNHLSVILVPEARNAVLGKTKLDNSILLHAPIDGKITLNDIKLQDPLREIFTLKQAFNIFFSRKDIVLSDLNEADFLKAYLFVKSIKNSDIEVKKISSVKEFAETGKIDDVLFELLKNKDIINEKESIEIVNAADVDGLGGRVSQMLKNAGFNVVSVTTSDDVATSKIIKRIEKTTTLAHILNIFRFPQEVSTESSVADITVLLGQDMRQRVTNL